MFRKEHRAEGVQQVTKTKKTKLPKHVKIMYAIVDVLGDGREKLRDLFEPEYFVIDPSCRGGRWVRKPSNIRIPITLKGYLTDVASNDDGTSREFTMRVTSATLAQGRAKRGKLLAGPQS